MAIAAAVSCSDRDDLDGRRRALPGLEQRARPTVSVDSDQQVAFDFYDNRVHAVVHQGGALVVNGRSPEFAKYASGGYGSGWTVSAEHGGALISGISATLSLPVDQELLAGVGDSVRIAARIRPAGPNQLATLFLNEHRLGDISMPAAEWQAVEISAPASHLQVGENRLRFHFRRSHQVGDVRSAASLEQLTLGGRERIESGPAGVDRVGHGQRAMAALTGAGATRYSYYLLVPTASRRPHLTAAVAGSGVAQIRIATTESLPARPTWEGQASAEWADVEVDLAEHAGRPVRIDFVSDGKVDWGRPRLAVGPGAAPPAIVERSYSHIILWTVSSLRRDRVASKSASGRVLRDFADRGLSFEVATSGAPSPAIAHAELMTGLRTLTGAIPEQARTLAEQLRAGGYATALISGNGFITEAGGFTRGFDFYRNPMRESRPSRAANLWQLARPILARNAQKRVFLYLATSDPHLPYTPSDTSMDELSTGGPAGGDEGWIMPARTAEISAQVHSGKRALTPAERRRISALYDGCVRDAGRAFAGMLEDLVALGVADRTVVILVGDHGEELFEEGDFGHGERLSAPVVEIPLAIAGPGLPAASTETAAELVDLYPTVLALAGLAPPSQINGANLLDLVRDPPAIPRPTVSRIPGRERAVSIGRYRLRIPLREADEFWKFTGSGDHRSYSRVQDSIARRAISNTFALQTAFESAWLPARWGWPSALGPGFAADQGM